MKLQEHDYGFEAVLPENRTPFKIKTSAKLFDILSSGIYKDKILAVIRELSCNAYDAHVVAKKTHVPFKLRLPTRLDPTFYVEDEGTGIDPERITDIYWTYGESSKTNSNDQIGALGLGSKSPFAYTKSSFVVKNRYQGVEYTYLCFINEDGMPDGSKVSEEPTDKPSGVTVEFAVRPEDITAFFDRTDRFFKRWGATMPIFVDMDVSEVIRSKPEKVIEGTEWYLEKVDRNRYADHQGAIAMQGNVPYPIEVGSIPKMPKELAIIASNPFIITFDMGEINFASSREALQYDERTCNNIIARLEEVRAELGKSFQEKIFKKGMTQLQFITNFRRTFREFTTTIQYNGGSFGADTDAWYVDLLLAKKKADRISYDGRNYQIAELIQGMISFDVDGHQAFGIYKLDRRNTRSARTYMRQYSTLKYTPIDDVEGQLINPGWTATSVIRAGDPLTFEWKNAAIPKRAELTQYYRVIQNANLFEAETHHNIPVDSEKMTFFVNDCGSSGEGRYKCLVERLGHTGYLINFDPKVTPVDTVVDQLKKLIESGLKGADIVMISEQPDHRPTIEKEKIEQGTMRVKSRTLVFESTDSSISVADNVTVKAKEIDYVLSDESIVKIADLQAEPFVLYVVKRRSPTALYDDVTSHSESIVVDNKIATALAAKYVLSDLVVPYVSKNQMDKRANGRSSLRLLVLNEGQIEWLKKRKVNLKGIKEVIAERIIALDTTEKFHDAVEHAAALKRVQVISSMYTTVQDKPAKRDRLTFVPGSNSLFKQIFAEYVAVRANNAALADQYAKVKIFEAVKGSSALGAAKSEDLSGQINKKYPLLRLLNVSHTSAADLGPIIDYIEQMDNL